VRRYELMLLLRPDLEDDKLQSAVEKVTRAIVNSGGALTKVSPWGKRRLAYPIQNQREASYFLIHFDIDPSAVRGIENGLRISEEVVRHLVVVIDHDVPDRREEAAVPAAAPAEGAGADGEEAADGSTGVASADASAADGQTDEAAAAGASVRPDEEPQEAARQGDERRSSP
jgi:small subunit ribosomal protein S6